LVAGTSGSAASPARETRTRPSVDRRSGWERALREAGIHPDPALVHVDDFSVDGGVRAGRALLGASGPTAVFVSSDSQAEGLLAVARRRGLSGDLAVFGFDGTRHSAYAEPAMSVVQQPLTEAAGVAIDLLGRCGPAEHRQLAFTLVIRRSCGCPFDPWLS
jgi:DNA-binding LacI/PurR family transcriptional regulator